MADWFFFFPKSGQLGLMIFSLKNPLFVFKSYFSGQKMQKITPLQNHDC
jgi:hypothetical protein